VEAIVLQKHQDFSLQICGSANLYRCYYSTKYSL